MEIIRKIISLEGGISRDSSQSFGVLTASTIYFKIQLNQKIDDLGLFSDYDFIPIGGLNLTSIDKNLRLDGSSINNWYSNEHYKVSGFSESRLDGLKSYDNTNQYVVNFDVEKQLYQNYEGNLINGVSRITSSNNKNIAYSYDANNDVHLGTTGQTSGLLFKDDLILEKTKLFFNSEGWNETNSSLSAIIKENYLLGIINQPEIENLVFIDRGNINIMENHLKMSEIESLDHLGRYGNGFFNIVKQ